MKRAIKMHAFDNVATLLDKAEEGDIIAVYDTDNHHVETLTAQEIIPYGNKIALRDIALKEGLVKYGAVIGMCTSEIKCGKLVHVHNVKSNKASLPKQMQKEIMREMQISRENTDEN